MLRTFVSAYPWDLIDEGLESGLDRLQGEVGIAGLSVWAACPPVTELRARTLEPRIFRTRGGALFRPDEAAYATTRFKPVASDWVKGPAHDPMTRIAAACTERNIELRILVSAAATGRLAQRYPDSACKNLFGAESQISLCLANLDVQEYLRCLIIDLVTTYRPAGVVLTDFVIAWYEAISLELQVPVALAAAEESALSTCFCESCHQRAGLVGVDVPRAMHALNALLQQALGGGRTGSGRLNDLLAENVDLRAYFQWRTAELTSLLRRLTESCARDLLLVRTLMAHERSQQDGLELSIPAAVITSIDAAGQLPAAACPGALRSEVGLSAAFIKAADGAELVGAFVQAGEQGMSGVQLDHLGILTDPMLTSVKQAVRFARRSRVDQP